MRKHVPIIISTVVGVVIIVVLFRFVNPLGVVGQLGRLGPVGVPVFLANALAILILGSCGWQVMLRAYGFRIPFRDVVGIKIVGFAVSYLTPSMYVGGEPVRVYVLSRKHGISDTTVAATVVVDKFLELAAGLLFVFLGSVWSLVVYDLPLQLFLGLAVLNGLFAAGMILLFVSFVYRIRALTGVIDALGKIRVLAASMQKCRPWVARMENEVHVAFAQRRLHAVLAFALHLAAGWLIFIKPAIFFSFLKTMLTVSQLALVFALTHVLLAFQFTPAALGLFELGEVGIYRLVGIGPEQALAFALMVRVGDFMGVLIAAAVGVSLGIALLRARNRE